MKIEITQDKENALLNRRDILFGVTPEKEVCSRKVVKNKLVALLDTKPGLLILDRMNTQYGMQEVVGYARLYDTVQDLNRIEPAYMIARNAAGETEEADDVKDVEETAATEEVTEAVEAEEVVDVEEAGGDSEEAEEEIEEADDVKDVEETAAIEEVAEVTEAEEVVDAEEAGSDSEEAAEEIEETEETKESSEG